MPRFVFTQLESRRADLDAAEAMFASSQAICDDPLLQANSGFVQRKSPLARKLSAMISVDVGADRATKQPAAQRKSRSPIDLLRALPSAISKSSFGSRRSPRLVAMREMPMESGHTPGLTPGLSAGRTSKSSKLQEKAKRWMSALGGLQCNSPLFL